MYPRFATLLADEKTMNKLNPQKCDSCDSRAVITDPSGVWCGRCALSQIAINAHEDGATTEPDESAARLNVPRNGTNTRTQPYHGKTDKPWEQKPRASGLCN